MHQMGDRKEAIEAIKRLWLEETRAITIDALCTVASNIHQSTEQFLVQLKCLEDETMEGLDRDSGKMLAVSNYNNNNNVNLQICHAKYTA